MIFRAGPKTVESEADGYRILNQEFSSSQFICFASQARQLSREGELNR